MPSKIEALREAHQSIVGKSKLDPAVERYRFRAGSSTFHAVAQKVGPSWHSFSFVRNPEDTAPVEARPVMRSALKTLAYHTEKHAPEVVSFSGASPAHSRLYHYLIHHVDAPEGYVPHIRRSFTDTSYAMVRDTPKARAKAASRGYAEVKRRGNLKLEREPDMPIKLARLPYEDMSPAARAAHALLSSGSPHLVPQIRRPVDRPRGIATISAELSPHAAPAKTLTKTPPPMRPVSDAVEVEPQVVKRSKSDYLTKLLGNSGRRIIGEDELAHAVSLHDQGHHPIAIADHLARHFPDRPTPNPKAVARIVGYKKRKASTPLQEYALHLAALGYPAKNIRLLVKLHPESKAALPKVLS